LHLVGEGEGIVRANEEGSGIESAVGVVLGAAGIEGGGAML